MKSCNKYIRRKIIGTVVGSFLFFAAAAIVNNSLPSSANAISQLSRSSITEEGMEFELVNLYPNIKLQKTDSQYLAPHIQLLKKGNPPVKKHKRYRGCIASQAC